MSTPETPSTSAWCVFEIRAKRFSLQALDDPQLPERLRAIEPLGEDAARQLSQLLVAARARQRRVANVVVEVEARVVHPEGPAQLERREGQPLAVARYQREPGLELRR